jgi:hypothetical protein
VSDVAPNYGPYVVEGEAPRRGGTARVFRAIDRRDQRVVALKLPASRDGIEAIRHEAVALRGLSHPGIVGFVADGTTPDGTPWLATEWIDGESLAERLARGPLGVDDTLVLARGIAATLSFTHAHGFVHRDLKPGNVMLAGGELGHPKLVDFGFARRLREGALLDRLDEAFRRVREAMGTPAYMAPEQARGDEAPDPRADVFSFGALLYRCLSGQAPFAGRDPLATLSRVLFDDPRPLRELAPRVPERVAALVNRALRKEPARRPRDGSALAQALRELEEPAMVGPASIAPMPIARTVVCVVVCRLPKSTVDAEKDDALARWGARVRLLRDAAQAERAELRLLGEGNVALLFDDEGDDARGTAALAQRATTAARSLARRLPDCTFAVACGHVAREAPSELLVRAADLVAEAEPGVLVDAVVDAMLPPELARKSDGAAKRLS